MSKLYFELPLKPLPMDFTVRNSREQIYRFLTQYREEDETGWILDIDDGYTNKPLVHGIPLVSGLDLMWQYNALNHNFHLIMNCIDGRTTPTAQSLGVEDKLILVFHDQDDLAPLWVMIGKDPLYPVDFSLYPLDSGPLIPIPRPALSWIDGSGELNPGFSITLTSFMTGDEIKIERSTDSLFVEVDVTTISVDTETITYEISDQPPGTYYIRVRVKRGDDYGLYSDPFTVVLSS